MPASGWPGARARRRAAVGDQWQALTVMGERIGESATRAPVSAEPPGAAQADARVLVVGYGRVGLMVADMLERHVPAKSVPCVFERLVGVEKVGAFELADAAVQMLVDGRHDHNGC